MADTIPPAINCPPDDTVQLGPDLCSVAYNYMVVAYDDQPGYVLDLIAGLPPGAEFPIGITTNWWVVTDVGGNNASCSFTVMVRNFPAPLNCRDTVQVFLDAACVAGLTAFDGLEGGPYGCVDSFLVQVDRSLPLGNGPWEPAVFGPADIDRFYGMRITDPYSGNPCWGFVQVDDTLPPVLDCPPISLSCIVDQLSPNYLRDSLGVAAGWPAVADNCYPSVNLSYSDIYQNLPCSDTGTVSGIVFRSWTAIDTRGNGTSCTQTITRQRLLNEVQLPPDITLSCQDTMALPEEAGLPFIMVGTRPFVLGEDSFCEIDALYTDSLEVLCGGSRMLHRKWEVYDACLPLSADNPLTGVQYISLPDTTGPSIDCPDRLIVQAPAFNCSGQVVLPDMVLYDDCSAVISYDVRWTANDSVYQLTGSLHDWPGNSPFLQDTLGRLDTLPLVEVGVSTLLFSATDLCGSTGLCTTELVLWDQAAPLAICDSVTVVNVPLSGSASVPADLFDNGSLDACNPVQFRARRNDSSDTLWMPEIEVSCSDIGQILLVTLRAYDVALPNGPLPGNYATGQYSDCTAQLWVTTDPAPQCIMPPDTMVSCQAFDPTLEAYGQPVLSCSVDSIALLDDLSLFDTICREGMIHRVLKVFNVAGDSSVCEQRITSANVQRYFIRFPDDQNVMVCDSSLQYGEPELFDEACGFLYVSFDDELFTMVPDACFRIERVWQVINWCTYDANQPLTMVPNPHPQQDPNDPANFAGPVVSAADATAPWTPTVTRISPDDPAPTNFSTFWSENANGYSYRQILNFTDDVPPVILNCSPNPIVIEDMSSNDSLLWFDDYQLTPGVGPSDLCEGQANLSLEVRDLCSGAGGSASYLLFLDLNGDGVQETVVDSESSPPSGTIFVGNSGNPNYSGGTMRDFDHRPVAPNLKFRFAVRSTSLGTVRTVRLAWNTASNPNGYVIPQLPLGTHRIQWRLTDLCGNETFCEYEFVINNSGVDCLMPVGRVSGVLHTETSQGVQFANVNLNGTGPNIPDFDLDLETDADGYFEFQLVLPVQTDYSLVPQRPDFPLNGVSTFDLLLISRHILGIQSLGSPYKLIGADANRSGNVSSFDILEFRRLILGIYDELPNNSSWRFVRGDFDFPDPENPFSTPFPEVVQVVDLQSGASTEHDFVGIKVGDMNSSALANGLQQPVDRNGQAVYFDLADRSIQAGAIVRIQLQPGVPLEALQFTMEYPGLDLLELAPGPGMQASDFAVFEKEHALTAAWFHVDDHDQPAFTVTLRARRDCRLSEVLRLSSRITPIGAFTALDGQAAPIELRFDSVVVEHAGLSVQPNPFSGHAILYCQVPVAGQAYLDIRDVAGRSVWRWQGWLTAGEYQLPIDLRDIPVTGVLSCHLQLGDQRLSTKLVKL